MILNLYSINDKKDGMTCPIPMSNESVAIRWYLSNREHNNDMKFTPDDFELWHIGTFDTETGELKDERREINV